MIEGERLMTIEFLTILSLNIKIPRVFAWFGPRLSKNALVKRGVNVREFALT